jgi:NADPH-dependent 2,4-dienoyl-CoA reductase/sulfur reductase-like enzyme
MTSKTFDIAVIGGGPAGMAAAQTAASNGASVILIDDANTLGGHFYKELPANFGNTSKYLHQKKLREIKRRQQTLTQSGAEVLLNARVWGIFDEKGATLNKEPCEFKTHFSLHLDHSLSGITSIQASHLILSPGVYDRPLPFPGWELPGVLTPGAVQMQIEKQGLLPGQRVLVAGSGPLQMIVAAALARHGVEVVAMLDTCSAFEGLPKILGALGGLRSRLKEGLESIGVLARHRVLILFRHAVYRALGTRDTGVNGVVIGKVDREGHPIPGSQRELQVDTICMAYGFIPSIAITLHLGCEHRYDTDLQAFIPEHNEYLETSVPGIFVAGDITGVGGKPLADLQGQLAAITALEQLKKITGETATIIRKRLTSAVRREKRFSRWLWNRYRIRPGLLELVDDDTCLCRCEAVRIGPFRESLKNGGQDLYGVKLRTRLGMGQCQGRYCVPNAALFIAAQSGKPVSQLALPSIRPPIFPVRLKDIDGVEKEFEEN